MLEVGRDLISSWDFLQPRRLRLAEKREALLIGLLKLNPALPQTSANKRQRRENVIAWGNRPGERLCAHDDRFEAWIKSKWGKGVS